MGWFLLNTAGLSGGFALGMYAGPKTCEPIDRVWERCGPAPGAWVLALVLAAVGYGLALLIQRAVKTATHPGRSRAPRYRYEPPPRPSADGAGGYDRQTRHTSSATGDDDDDLLYRLIASVLSKILGAHGDDAAERLFAAQMLSALSDDELTVSQAAAYLRAAELVDYIPREIALVLPEGGRLAFLRLAVEVALVDGTVTATETVLLHELAESLSLPLSAVDTLIGLLGRDASAAQRDEVHQACDTLGVAHDADIGTIRAAYRKLIRQHHPDLVPEAERAAATARTSEINAAYDLLVGARSA